MIIMVMALAPRLNLLKFGVFLYICTLSFAGPLNSRPQSLHFLWKLLMCILNLKEYVPLNIDIEI